MRLARALARFHWSEMDLVNASGVDKETISRVLNGSREISFANARRVIQAFHFARGWQLVLLTGLVGMDELDSQGGFEDYRQLVRSRGLASSPEDVTDLSIELYGMGQDDDVAEPESSDSEFLRYVRLVGLLVFVYPWELRHAEARERYVERVLRPCALKFPTAAWQLARYWEGLIPGLPSSKVVWSLYRLARRGRWPQQAKPMHPPVRGLRSRPRSIRDHDYRQDIWHRPNRAMHFDENLAIIKWDAGRLWPDSEEFILDADLEREIARVQAEPHGPWPGEIFIDDPL